MKIANEFRVAAPLEQTWGTLLDIQRVASCLPGAVIDASDGSGAYRGRFKVKIGAVTTQYSGTAKLLEADEDANVAVFVVQGSEVGGQGSASATITNRLASHAGQTIVTVETELDVTGRAAQFGRGLMADVAGAILGQFAARLEALILAPPPSDRSTEHESGPTDDLAGAPERSHLGAAHEIAADDGDALNLGGALWLPLVRRAAPALVVGVALVLVILSRKRRRQRGITLRINF